MLQVKQTNLNFLLGKESSEKKTSKNFEMKMNSISKFDYKLFIILFFVSLAPAFSVYADENLDYSVTVEPALNITTSSNKVSLDLNPLNHDFDSQDLTVSVSTNNETGYKLYVNTEKTTNNPNGNKLIEKDDNSLYIETLSNEVNDNNFTANRWGYKLDSNSTKFSPFNPGALILSSKTIADGKNTDDITTMVFAAKVGYETKAGTYALALNFQATANPHIKTIADAEYLQEVSAKGQGGCPADLSSTQTYTLKDSRDGQEYKVARLKDGNCWMITNLNLGAINLTEDLTSENTNSSQTITATAFNAWNRVTSGNDSSWTIPKFSTNTGNDSNGMPYNALYNFCAASATAWCYGTSEGAAILTPTEIDTDLCPAGWRLPLGGNSDEFQSLYDKYNSFALLHNSVSSGGAAFTLSGRFDSGNPSYKSQFGDFWSSTRAMDSNDYVYALRIDTRGGEKVYPVYSYGRPDGLAIRCILK